MIEAHKRTYVHDTHTHTSISPIQSHDLPGTSTRRIGQSISLWKSWTFVSGGKRCDGCMNCTPDLLLAPVKKIPKTNNSSCIDFYSSWAMLSNHECRDCHVHRSLIKGIIRSYHGLPAISILMASTHFDANCTKELRRKKTQETWKTTLRDRRGPCWGSQTWHFCPETRGLSKNISHQQESQLTRSNTWTNMISTYLHFGTTEMYRCETNLHIFLISLGTP